MEFSDLFNFDKFVAPFLVKIVYWVGLAVIGLLTLSSIIGSTSLSYYTGSSGVGIGGILMTLIVAVLAALIWRVVCEIWMVIFSINDRLAAIMHNTDR